MYRRRRNEEQGARNYRTAFALLTFVIAVYGATVLARLVSGSEACGNEFGDVRPEGGRTNRGRRCIYRGARFTGGVFG